MWAGAQWVGVGRSTHRKEASHEVYNKINVIIRFTPNSEREVKIQMCVYMWKHTPIHTYMYFQILKYFGYLSFGFILSYEVFNIKEYFSEQGSFHSMELFCFLFVHLLPCFLDIQASGYIT